MSLAKSYFGQLTWFFLIVLEGCSSTGLGFFFCS